MYNKRIIGSYTGAERGPLVIVFGGMHGNEPAGHRAIDLMIKMIEVEPITNPNFVFKGKILGLIGNIKAKDKGVRFIKEDLNRCWYNTKIEKIKSTGLANLEPEEQEIKEILEIIHNEIKEYKPKKIFVLDLHTTSSKGGIFTIVPNDQDNVNTAIQLNAPVILGLLKGVHGTSTEYFNKIIDGIPCVSLTFESGNHNDILSVNRAIAAMTNLLTIIGCFEKEHVENRHNRLLKEFSKGLPKLSKLLYKHQIKNSDKFVMIPGYSNFQKIKKGEVLAHDKNGEIKSEYNGRILMPLYQKQGDEGFFIIKEIKDIKDCCNKN